MGISCKVNEELRQHASTGDIIFDVATLIEVISKGITLRVADIIATGTRRAWEPASSRHVFSSATTSCR